ncbi:MAG: AAA family ATPase, partial [Polyangiaceae bacterium]|nr:AAA family ATPase [Polyangiaceae bacterium]
GNVRELVNAVDYVIALAPEDSVTDHDLPEDVRLPRAAAREFVARGRYTARDDERTRIETTLRANDFHRQRTADALGMDRVTLYRKLKDYGLGDAPRVRSR